MGRWTSKDPIRFEGGVNVYAYALNDHLNFVDLTGHDPFRHWGGFSCPTWLGWLCGPSPKDIYDDAVEEAIDRRYKDSLHNGKGDAFKHCMASCRMRQVHGNAAAQVGGWLNEQKADALSDQPDSEAQMDYDNNACGRSYEGDCANNCQRALDDGVLTTQF